MTRSPLSDRHPASVKASQAPSLHSVSLTCLNSPIASTPLGGLILEWVEQGRVKTWLIHQQLGQTTARVRIGQDPLQCNIVLADPTVSKLHGEIFFDLQRQRFYFWNLDTRRRTIINSLLILAQGEAVVLTQGSSLQLGEVTLKITAMALNSSGTFYRPVLMPSQQQAPQATEHSTQVVGPQPIQPQETPSPQARQPRPSSGVATRLRPQVLPVGQQRSLILGSTAILFGLLGGYFGLAAIRPDPEALDASTPPVAALDPAGECQVIEPTAGDDARLFHQPSRQAFSGERIDRNTRVGLLGESSAFAKVQLPDGRRLWVFNDQIQPCERQ